VKKFALLILAAILLFPITAMLLSELGEVAVIRGAGAGDVPETRIWLVETPEGLLVRGSAGKAWLEAARSASVVELDRDGVARRYTVVEQPGPEARQRLNELMREKYGLADQMVGVMRAYDASVPLLLKQTTP